MPERPLSETALLRGIHTQFLEQLNDEEFWNYAVEIARSAPSTREQIDEYLICELGRGSCLLSLSTLREIVPPSYQFTLLPAAPIWMPGIAAWRGEPIAVIDLEAYLANSRAPLRSDGMLLIAQLDGLTLGFFVAAVGQVTTLIEQQIRSPDQTPTWCVPSHREVVQGVYSGLEDRDNALILDTTAIANDVVRRLRVTVDDD